MADLSREELLDELADMEEQVPFLRMRCAEARVDLSERITRTVSVYGTADPYAWPSDSFHHVQQMEDATSALEVRLSEAVAYRDELREQVGVCPHCSAVLGDGDADTTEMVGERVCAACAVSIVRDFHGRGNCDSPCPVCDPADEVIDRAARAAIAVWGFGPGDTVRDADGYCHDGFTCDTVGAVMAEHGIDLDRADEVISAVERILAQRATGIRTAVTCPVCGAWFAGTDEHDDVLRSDLEVEQIARECLAGHIAQWHKGTIIIREAVCSRCGETFVPCDDDDLEHCVTEMGEPCGGRGTMVGAWHG